MLETFAETTSDANALSSEGVAYEKDLRVQLGELPRWLELANRPRVLLRLSDGDFEGYFGLPGSLIPWLLCLYTLSKPTDWQCFLIVSQTQVARGALIQSDLMACCLGS